MVSSFISAPASGMMEARYDYLMLPKDKLFEDEEE